MPPPVAVQEQKDKIVHWKPGKAPRLEDHHPAPSLDVLRQGDRVIIQDPSHDKRTVLRHTGIYIDAYKGRFGSFKHAVIHSGTRGVPSSV